MALRQLPDELPDTLPLNLTHIIVPGADDLDKDRKEPALLSSSLNIGTSGFSSLQGNSHRSSGSSTSPPASGGRTNPTVARHPSQSSHHSNRDLPSTKLSENENDSPALSRQLTTSSSQTQLQDLMNSNKAVKSGLHQSFTNDSVLSLSSSHHDSVPEKPSSQLHFNLYGSTMHLPATAANDQQAKLLRYLYLLYNDLVFERFMKQQHLTHIGALKRRHVREAASEAETQNIITANKHLKQRLEEAKKAEVQAKTEAEKSRTLAKKWEADIFNKLKLLREEQRKWNAEGSALQVELNAAKDEAEELRKLLCEVEVRELKLKQNMQSADINFGELERLRSEIGRLTESERDYQAKEADYQAAITQMAEADSRAGVSDMKLAALQSDFKQTCGLLQSQIAVLNSRLRNALKTGGERNAESPKGQLEAVLEASRTMHTEMKKRISELSRKNTELQARIFEMQSAVPNRSQLMSGPHADTEDELSSDSEGPPDSRNQRRQSFSDPELFEATSYNATPPLEPFGTSKTAATQARHSTPQEAEGSSAKIGNTSPANERYFGRGKLFNMSFDLLLTIAAK
jgi:hypothetical protein